MNLWIVYKDEIGVSRVVAEILQNRLEEFIDVSVGNASKISPDMVLEESVDFLIIIDTSSESSPSDEIQEWLNKYREISEKNDVTIKDISSLHIIPSEITIEGSWEKILQVNVKSERYEPQTMQLIIDKTNLTLEKGAIGKIKKFSEDFINILIDANV